MSSEEFAGHIPRVVITQCTDGKRDEPAPAKDIYDESDLHVKQWTYAELVGDYQFIQSAKHGLLHPDEVIEPYDKHAKNIDNAEAWAAEIADELDEMFDDAIIELLGGKDYADPLTPELEKRGFEVLEPLRGQKIGPRKRSLMNMVNRTMEEFA